MGIVGNVAQRIKNYAGNILGNVAQQIKRRMDAKEVDWQKTNGEWTHALSYAPSRKEMTIKFKSGFTAVYPNIEPATFERARQGAKTRDGKRTNSVGAWLHRNEEIMRHNYREKT
jgi:hypothetical protein